MLNPMSAYKPCFTSLIQTLSFTQQSKNKMPNRLIISTILILIIVVVFLKQ